jgi:hypothetical protein
MKSKIIWLRISYWTAAIADFGIAISILVPERAGMATFVYPMGLVSVIALSWGVLLIIADQEPIERRWVLLPTIIVVALLNCFRIYAALNNMIEFSITILIIGVLILILLIFSYIFTSGIEKEN